MMKKLKMNATSLIILMLLSGVLMVSCKKDTQIDDELNYLEEIVGIYSGTFSSDDLKTIITANAEIQMNADSSIWFHCYGGEIDTTFMLDIFDHNDSILVCLTGTEFANEYGHARIRQGSMMNWSDFNSGGHGMGGNMMGNNTNLSNDSTGWYYHMREEHHGENEEHFGGFDMNNHTFGYRFRDPQNLEMFIKFESVKNTNQ